MRTVILDKSDINRGPLILVNRQHPIVGNSISHFVRLTMVDDQYKNVLLETQAATLLSQILKAINCRNEIIPISGYRSYEEQVKIYHDSLLKNGSAFTEQYVALPNRSEHQTGLAIDLGENKSEIDYIRPDFPYTGIYGDFRLIASKYGFIERYGEGKKAITGIAHEPWHFRYVGYPHAQIMKDNHLTLEEYLLFIKEFPYNGKHFFIKENKKEIEVFYVHADNNETEIQVPDHDYVQLSGNNIDGFVVTMWRR